MCFFMLSHPGGRRETWSSAPWIDTVWHSPGKAQERTAICGPGVLPGSVLRHLRGKLLIWAWRVYAWPHTCHNCPHRSRTFPTNGLAYTGNDKVYLCRRTASRSSCLDLVCKAPKQCTSTQHTGRCMLLLLPLWWLLTANTTTSTSIEPTKITNRSSAY